MAYGLMWHGQEHLIENNEDQTNFCDVFPCSSISNVVVVQLQRFRITGDVGKSIVQFHRTGFTGYVLASRQRHLRFTFAINLVQKLTVFIHATMTA
ncbi:hypothetical protein YC2023_055972 [Brassica napus]